MKKILEIKNLSIFFTLYKKKNHVIKKINYHLDEGEILGIVGESGCGKSVCVQSIVKLLPSPPANYSEGEILFEKEDLFKKNQKELAPFRGAKIGYIFQDPMTCLNPTMKVGKQILEVMKKDRSKEKIYDLLTEVGINNPKERFSQYPHQLSGGQKQRIMIAIALAMNPKIIIADEPTTALDVTIQAQILHLLKEIQKKRSTSIIFISHDLKIVASLANRIIVMYAGQIVEEGPCQNLIYSPKHPYTKLLLLSVPSISTTTERLHTIKGSPPDLFDSPAGCCFASRCPHAKEICFEKMPKQFNLKNNQKVSCWLYTNI